MTKVFIIFLTPLLILSQEKYIKNNHVKIGSKITHDNYVVDYSFIDHESTTHNIICFFNQNKTDSMIAKFGLPYSIFEPYDISNTAINNERHNIIKNGLFLSKYGKIIKDKKALIEYYKPPTLQIANYIIKYLQANRIDTRKNRIEIAMKFVQDIPYAIPKENKKIYKNGYITPLEVLIEGYGDCDSKTILFVCIMSYLIPEDDIVFVSTPGHIFSAIKDNNSSHKINSDEYIPQSQQKEFLNHGTYVDFNDDKYFICETAGPGRPNYGQSNQKIKLCYIEKVDLSQGVLQRGNCYHANHMSNVKDEKRLAFEYHSCYKFNPPTNYELTAPAD